MIAEAIDPHQCLQCNYEDEHYHSALGLLWPLQKGHHLTGLIVSASQQNLASSSIGLWLQAQAGCRACLLVAMTK